MKRTFLLTAIVLISISTLFMGTSCHKSNDPDPDSFYFRCKVDGQDYRPNGCANCVTCTIYQDTIFLLGANRAFESLLIGIVKLDKTPIKLAKYNLGGSPQQRGSYKNSTTIDDKFYTDSLRTGVLDITTLDTTNKIVSGTFSFNAYNPVQNKTVSVTEGKFRWKYTTN